MPEESLRAVLRVNGNPSPTTELMLVRTVIEAEKLAPTVGHLADALTSGSYVAALEHLANLQLRIGHMATIVTILRDWEHMSERITRKEVHGGTATKAIARSARAGRAP